MVKTFKIKSDLSKVIIQVPQCWYKEYDERIINMIFRYVPMINHHRDSYQQVKKLESISNSLGLHISRETLSTYLAFYSCTELSYSTLGLKKGYGESEKAKTEVFEEIYLIDKILKVLACYKSSVNQSYPGALEVQNKYNGSTKSCTESVEQNAEKTTFLEHVRYKLDQAKLALSQTGMFSYSYQAHIIELFRPILNTNYIDTLLGQKIGIEVV